MGVKIYVRDNYFELDYPDATALGFIDVCQQTYVVVVEDSTGKSLAYVSGDFFIRSEFYEAAVVENPAPTAVGEADAAEPDGADAAAGSGPEEVSVGDVLDAASDAPPAPLPSSAPDPAPAQGTPPAAVIRAGLCSQRPRGRS